MSNQIHTATEALAALASIKDRLGFYRVNQADEMEVLPGAVCTTPEELRAIAYLLKIAEAYALGFKYLATNPCGWGASTSPVIAVRKAKLHISPGNTKRHVTKLFLAHPDTEVHGDGSWSYPEGFAPIELKEVSK